MSIADDLAAVAGIWDQNGSLATYARALGSMFAEVESYAADTDDTVGWQSIWDVNLAPHNALPWLAQAVGERLPAGVSDAAARAQIKATPNQYRGTPNAVVAAVSACLTGSRIVELQERWNGTAADDDWLSVVTFAQETPDQQAVLNALRRTVPADINIYYAAVTQAQWQSVEAGESDWSALEAKYGPTWADVAGATPGYVVYD